MKKLERKKIMDSILDAIGNTPLVKLNRVAKGIAGNVLVKCEYLNPSGSIKDRMAIRMIEEAESRGKIKPGDTKIVEASSGNTAIALSMVCAVKGYPLKIYFPEATMVPEKIGMLKRFGAQLEQKKLDDEDADRLAKEAGLHGAAIEVPGRVQCLNDESKSHDIFWTRQFSNPANKEGQSTIAKELLEQTDGHVDVFIASIGTGGTLLGVSQILKKELPNVKCIAVQPSGWEGWRDPLSPSTKYIPGVTGGLTKEIRDSGIVDEVVWVGNKEAREMAYRLSGEEGIFCGMSSGAQVFVAVNEAKKPAMKGKNIITVLVDRGDRYFNDERYIT